MSEVTGIITLVSKGKVIGWHDNVNKMCVAAEDEPSVEKTEPKTPPKAKAAAQIAARAATSVKAERSWWKTLLFGGPSGASATGCSFDSTGVKNELGDAGVPFNPADTDAQPNDAGFIELDGGIVLPNAILPAAAFDIAGEGGKYQSTPAILYESPILWGKNLQNLNLYVEIGTDSAGLSTDVFLTDPDLGIDLSGQQIDINEDGNIDINDADGNGVETYTLPGNACYPGMVNMTPLSAGALSLTQEERETYGLEGCGDADYLPLANCPSHETKRLKLFLGSYTLERYSRTGTDEEGNPVYEPTGETLTETVTSEDDAYNGIGQELGVVCDDTPAAYQFNIPSSWHSDGNLYVKMGLTVVVAAKDLPSEYAGNYYKTKLLAIMKAQGEE